MTTPGTRTVTLNYIPTGYSVGYTLCYNSKTCHSNTPTPGSSATVNVPAGGFADLYWHLVPPANESVIQILAAGERGWPISLYPDMELLINDIPLAKFYSIKGDFINRVFEKFTYIYPSTVNANQIKVKNIQTDWENGRLRVDKITINGVAYETESPTTYSTGTFDTVTICNPGYKQSEFLDCAGTEIYFAYAQGISGPTPTPTPVGSGVIQGRIRLNGVVSKCPGCTYAGQSQCENAPVLDATVNVGGVRGGSFKTTGCNGGGPMYGLTTTAEGHTVSLAVPSGYTVGYTLCYNSYTCHNNTPTPESSVNVNVPANGYADLYWHVTPASAYTVKIFAAGQPGGGVYPSMDLYIKGGKVASYTNIQGNTGTRVFQEFTYIHPNTVSLSDVKIQFTNDYYGGSGNDRNLMVDRITINGVAYQTEAPTTYSTGSWRSSDACAPGYKQSEWLHCSGYFQYDQRTTSTPTPTRTPTPTPGTPAYSNLNATMNSPSPASFSFGYSGPSATHHIDVSTLADMSWDVYVDFGNGTISPVTVTNPTKWSVYTCGRTLYWRARQGDFYSPTLLSSIKATTVTCG